MGDLLFAIFPECIVFMEVNRLLLCSSGTFLSLLLPLSLLSPLCFHIVQVPLTRAPETPDDVHGCVQTYCELRLFDICPIHSLYVLHIPDISCIITTSKPAFGQFRYAFLNFISFEKTHVDGKRQGLLCCAYFLGLRHCK